MALSAAAGGKPTVARFVIVMGHFRSWHLGTVDAMQHYVRCRWQIRSGGEKLKALLLTQAVWKRFSYPNNYKQPGVMDLDAIG
jgi:hypothetical protein